MVEDLKREFTEGCEEVERNYFEDIERALKHDKGDLGYLFEHSMLYVEPFLWGLINLNKETAQKSVVFRTLGFAVGLNKYPRGFFGRSAGGWGEGEGKHCSGIRDLLGLDSPIEEDQVHSGSLRKAAGSFCGAGGTGCAGRKSCRSCSG